MSGITKSGILWLAIFALSCLSCFDARAQDNINTKQFITENSGRTDRIRMQLSGNVRSVFENKYSFDTLMCRKPGRILQSRRLILFSRDGNMSNDYILDSKQRVWAKSVFRYNKAGNKTAQSDYYGKELINKETYVYDLDKNLVKETEWDVSKKSVRSFTYQYKTYGDSTETRKIDDGQLLIRTVSKRGITSETTEYKYNRDNSLFVKYIFRFNENGTLKESQFYAADEKLALKDIYVYNELGLLKEKQSFSNTGMNLLLKVMTEYKYDSTNNIIIEKTEFDHAHNIVKQWSYRYKYDKNRNWVKQTELLQGKVIAEYIRTIIYYQSHQ